MIKKLISASLAALVLTAPVLAAPAVGAPAPIFALNDQHGKPRALEEFKGKWVVLYFYPKADTPGCTEEACGFRDEIVVLRALGAEVVGVSTDSVDAIKAFGKKYELPFTLLADPEGKVAESYGALVNLGVMKIAKRHSFLIDPQGRVVKRYTDIDTKDYAKVVAADLRQLVKKN